MWMSHPNVAGVVTVADTAFYGGWDTLGWVADVAPAGPPLPDAGWPVSEGEVLTLVGAQVAAQLPASVDTALVPFLPRTEATTTYGRVSANAANAANTRRFMGKLYRGVADATVLIISDSTACTIYRWVRLWAVMIAAKALTHTVVLHQFDDPTGTWNSVAQPDVTLQTGTGSKTLHIYNFSVSGMNCSYGLAQRFAPGIVATNPDCVIVSSGKNEGHRIDLGAPTTFQTGLTLRGQYLAATEGVTRAFPDAGLMCLLQCPSATTFVGNNMAATASIIENIAAKRGYGVIDVHDAFNATGAPDTYVRADGVHPTDSTDAPAPNGSLLWAQVVDAAFTYDPASVTRSQQPSSLSTVGRSLLTNGDFAAFTAPVPDGWTATGCTTTKDVRAGWFESANGYSVRMQATGAAQSKLAQAFNAKPFAGQSVALFVRYRAAAAQRASAGSGRFALSDGTNTVTSTSTFYSFDAIQTAVLVMPVVAAATSLTLTLYADTGAVSTADISIDSVSLVLGDLPRQGIAGLPGATGATGPAAAAQVDFMSSVGGFAAFLFAANTPISFSSANQSILTEFRPHRDISLNSLIWFTGATASGNYDIGIYDAAGNRLWSKGSTAWPAVTTRTAEVVSPVVALTAGTRYYLALTADNTAALFRGVGESFTDQVKSVTGEYLSKLFSTSFPLPATLAITNPGSRAGKYPAIQVAGV